jgi:hypothetical protein
MLSDRHAWIEMACRSAAGKEYVRGRGHEKLLEQR